MKKPTCTLYGVLNRRSHFRMAGHTMCTSDFSFIPQGNEKINNQFLTESRNRKGFKICIFRSMPIVTGIVYTEGNREMADEIVSVIEGLDNNFKAVCYDDEEYFGFFTPASQPRVISEHCVLFLVVVADNHQQDKHAKYVSSMVSMAKANTAQIRPVLFSDIYLMRNAFQSPCRLPDRFDGTMKTT